MSEFVGKTKRVLNRAITTKGQMNSGLNQEFVDTRRRLDDISGAVKRLSNSISVTQQSWTAVARQQRDFTQSLSNSFPEPGEVQSYTAGLAKDLRDIQREITNNDTKESPHKQIMSVLGQYLDLLQSIQTEYSSVEKAHTEKMRYQKKVDRLESKNNSSRKHSDQLTRNVEKLDSAQNNLDTKIDAILIRMRAAFQKHEAVLQCAHHSFWMANDTHLGTIEQTTHDIRAESVAVHKLLLGLDMTEDTMLLPVPRPMNLIEGGSADVPTITGGTNNESQTHSETAKKSSQSELLVVSDDGSSDSDVTEDEEAAKLNIPGAPMTFPSTIPNTTASHHDQNYSSPIAA